MSVRVRGSGGAHWVLTYRPRSPPNHRSYSILTEALYHLQYDSKVIRLADPGARELYVKIKNWAPQHSFCFSLHSPQLSNPIKRRKRQEETCISRTRTKGQEQATDRACISMSCSAFFGVSNDD